MDNKRTNHALDVGPLPGGSRRGENLLDSHLGNLFAKVLAENGVAITQQIARWLVKGKRFAAAVRSIPPWGGRSHGNEECAGDRGLGPETREALGNEL